MTLVHIHAPKGHYIGQVRLYGHRKWQTVTDKCAGAEPAMAGAVMHMSNKHKRARVLFLADWYEPTVVMECKR
jgi:hypothetical protein